ncbi:hypothetical protein C7I84_23905 [Mesorhizobium ephedrae]|uniref:Outer membrane protein beta-barrel domain-containing protein n=2 Tax=Kumtagia ephedrae TaxID=2116701 RepID=A0A2P7RXC4_9HYPH|nr:DUF481 domain-containing protein [Mesorhizobium ephedrae]PSJ54856.1 hypothetical protein C7I84_23905 [Mesorhizobium ephedrae]
MFSRLETVLTLGLLAAVPAQAADVPIPMSPEQVEAEADGWTFAVSPYFWAAGLSGDIAQFGLPATIHIDADFGDIFNNLDFAAMAIGEARYDRFSIFGDVMYTKLTVGSGTPRGIVADSVDVTSETFAGLVGAGYSLFKDDRSYFDVVAGARVWSVNTEISVNGGLLDGADVSDGETWVDGLAGIRARYAFTDAIYVTGWGLVGAGQADLDWDVAAALGYKFNDTFSAVAGYRALGVDYSKDGFVFDAVQQGPIMGLVVHF